MLSSLIAFVLFVVTLIVVLTVEGGYGFQGPGIPPEDRTAITASIEAGFRIDDTRIAATEIATDRADRAKATAETAFPVLATRRAWLEGLRAQSDGYLDGVFDPCVPVAGAFDPCATGRPVE